MKSYIKGVVKDTVENDLFEAVASTGGVDRDGDTIAPKGWELDNYMKNPILLFAHNYHELPVGKFISLEKSSKGLVGKFKFSTIKKAQELKTLVKEGIINTLSVGFMEKESDDKDATKILKQELLEISLVSVPSNPEAVITARSKGLNVDLIVEKGVIPYRDHGVAEEGAAWNGPAMKREADIAQLRKYSTWFDSENPEVKSSYKLPHHRLSDGDAVWAGVRASMSALLGARGGAKIPDEDRKGVYNHLAKHYKAFDKPVPEFKYVELLNLVFKDLNNRVVTLEKSKEGSKQKAELELVISAKDKASTVIKQASEKISKISKTSEKSPEKNSVKESEKESDKKTEKKSEIKSETKSEVKEEKKSEENSKENSEEKSEEKSKEKSEEKVTKESETKKVEDKNVTKSGDAKKTKADDKKSEETSKKTKETKDSKTSEVKPKVNKKVDQTNVSSKISDEEILRKSLQKVAAHVGITLHELKKTKGDEKNK